MTDRAPASLPPHLLSALGVTLMVVGLAGCPVCEEGEVRRGSQCVRTCNSGEDCLVSEQCMDGECQPATLTDAGRGSSSSSVSASSSASTSAGSSSTLDAGASSASADAGIPDAASSTSLQGVSSSTSAGVSASTSTATSTSAESSSSAAASSSSTTESSSSAADSSSSSASARPSSSSSSSGATCSITGVPCVEAKRIHDVHVDGDVQEWDGVERVPFPGWGSWVGADAPPPDADLSAQFAVAWNGTDLFILVEVEDDSHVLDDTGIQLWHGDCVQVALDTVLAGHGPGSYPSNVLEFGAALQTSTSGNRTLLYRWMPTTGNETLVSGAVRRTGTRTVYELSVPTTRLPAGTTFTTGTELRFDLTVNDNDGNRVDAGGNFGWESWLEVTPGVVALLPDKSSRGFAVLRLVP